MKDKFNPVQKKRLRELAGLVTEGTIPVRGYIGKRGLPRRTYGQGQQHLPAWDEPRPKKSKVPEPPKEYVDTKEDIYPEVVRDIQKITVPIRIERGKLVKAPEMSPEDKAYLELAIDTAGATTGDYLYACKGWENVQKALEAEPRLEKALNRQCEYQADSEWNPKIIEPVWFFKQHAVGSLFENVNKNSKMSTNFDIKSFMINEGLTRVSRDRKRLLKESVGFEYEGFDEEWEDSEQEVDPEVLDALKKGHKTKSYTWTYDEEDPESTVIDSVTGMSSFVSRLTDEEYLDLYKELEDAGLIVKKLDEAASENVTDQDYESYREWQRENGWDDETIDAAIEIWKQHPDVFAIELENPIVDDLEAFVEEPELYLSGDPEDLATAVKQNIYRR